jgi:hypothetical protein
MGWVTEAVKGRMGDGGGGRHAANARGVYAG